MCEICESVKVNSVVNGVKIITKDTYNNNIIRIILYVYNRDETLYYYVNNNRNPFACCLVKVV